MAKPFLQRLSLDLSNLKIIAENRPKNGGFSQFKATFFGKLWNNVKTNWLMLLFCLPLVVWIIYCQIKQINTNGTLPYSFDLSLYSFGQDAYQVGAAMDLQLAMQRALWAMPLLIIASLGLAGVFNVAKYMVWGFQIKIMKTFFRGVKNSFVPFVWVGMMLGICFLLITLVAYGFPVWDTPMVGRVFAYIGVGVFCLFVLYLTLFIATQAAVFNLTLLEILKNSLYLGLKFVLQNSLILVAGLVSMVLPLLTFHSIVQIVAYMAFFFCAFSWTASVWTVYTQYLFEMIFENMPEKEKAAPTTVVKVVKEVSTHPEKSDSPAAKPKTNQPYQNPKKKKKKN